MLTINFYHNKAEVNRFNKTDYLTEVITLQGTFRNECSVINPEILVETNDSDLFKANYAYIELWNRYYFIKEIIAYRTNLWQISLTVDLLMSFKEQLLPLECAVGRSENLGDLALKDDKLPFKYIMKEQITEYKTIFNDYTLPQTASFIYVAVVSNDAYTAPTPPASGSNIKPIPQPRNFIDTSTVKVYRLKNNIFNQFVDKVLSDTTFVPMVVSIYMLPSDRIANDIENIGAMKIGNRQIDFTLSQPNDLGLVIHSIVPSQNKYDISINDFLNISNSFYNYKPYSTYEVYLPFYGWYEIDLERVKDSVLNIRYTFDYTSGKCGIQLYTFKNRVYTDIIDSFEIDFSIQIPINYTNSADMERTRASNGLNFAKGILSGIGQAATGGIMNALLPSPTSGVDSVTGGITQMVGSALNFGAQEINNVPTGGAQKVNSGFQKLYSCNSVLLRKTYSEPLLNTTEYQKYLKFYGAPCAQVKLISELLGYNEIVNIHIENINGLLSLEQVELFNILTSGVIF